MRESSTILKLQSSIIALERAKLEQNETEQRSIRDKTLSLNIEEVANEELDQDVYYTFIKCVRDGLLDPDELLVEAVKSTITVDLDYLRLVGLALRLGASPNLYVSTEDIDGNLTVLHILYFAWEYAPQTEEDLANLKITDAEEEGVEGDINATPVTDVQDVPARLALISKSLSHVFAILCTAGSRIDLPVVDADILLSRKRAAAKNPNCVGQTSAYTGKKDAIETVKGMLMRDMEDNEERYERVMEKADFYTLNRNDLKTVVSSNNLARRIVTYLDIAEAVIVADEELVQDDNNIIIKETIIPSLRECVRTFANKCVEAILKLTEKDDSTVSLVTFADAEEAFVIATDVYNVPTVTVLLRKGLTPRYNHIDRTILLANQKTREKLFASAAALNRMLIEMVERGVGIDEEQLKIIAYYSPATHQEIKKILAIPYWKRTCSVGGEFVRPDLKRLAREANIPPDSAKSDICRAFADMDQAELPTLTRIARSLQEKRLAAKNTKIGMVVNNAVNGSSRPANVCYNAAYLTKPEYEFADVDLVLVPEADKTYCFESTDYMNILEPGDRGEPIINPITGNKLNITEIEEMESKLNTLIRSKLPLESKGISAGIKHIKSNKFNDGYEGYVMFRITEFLKLCEEYEIDTTLFTLPPASGGLTNEEMESIMQDLFEDNGILFNIKNRNSCVRSFSYTVMERVDDINKLSQLPDQTKEEFEEYKENLIDDLFNKLKDLLGNSQ